MTKRYMNVTEVAEMLGKTRRTVRRLADRRAIPCKVVIEKRYLFDPDDIIELKRSGGAPDLRKRANKAAVQE